MYKFGLKLWSTNTNYINEAVKLYEKKVYDYIELFAVPNSFEKYETLWKNLDIPFLIHAPHTYAGLNLAKKEFLQTNMKLAQQAIEYADTLSSDIIIFHPGIDGNLQETVRQINMINEPRIVIENKPYHTIDDNRICNGYSPDQIKEILCATNCKFCFDLGHAIYAANAQSIDGFTYLKKFMQLSPYMYHISDGSHKGIRDEHKNIGSGTFNLKKIISILPPKSIISIETKKNYLDSLKDFEQDVQSLKNYCS